MQRKSDGNRLHEGCADRQIGQNKSTEGDDICFRFKYRTEAQKVSGACVVHDLARLHHFRDVSRPRKTLKYQEESVQVEWRVDQA